MSQSVHQSQPVSRHPSTKEEEGPRKKLVSAVLFEKLSHQVLVFQPLSPNSTTTTTTAIATMLVLTRTVVAPFLLGVCDSRCDCAQVNLKCYSCM